MSAANRFLVKYLYPEEPGRRRIGRLPILPPDAVGEAWGSPRHTPEPRFHDARPHKWKSPCHLRLGWSITVELNEVNQPDHNYSYAGWGSRARRSSETSDED